jgi:hypothetical protein
MQQKPGTSRRGRLPDRPTRRCPKWSPTRHSGYPQEGVRAAERPRKARVAPRAPRTTQHRLSRGVAWQATPSSVLPPPWLGLPYLRTENAAREPWPALRVSPSTAPELLALLLLVSRQGAHAHSSVHAVLNRCVSRWSSRRHECRDMADGDRLQGRSGRRIRAPKQSGAVSFILFRVRAKVQFVQFRATMTSWPEPWAADGADLANRNAHGGLFPTNT